MSIEETIVPDISITPKLDNSMESVNKSFGQILMFAAFFMTGVALVLLWKSDQKMREDRAEIAALWDTVRKGYWPATPAQSNGSANINGMGEYSTVGDSRTDEPTAENVEKG
jgi:hypothetical protein